MDKIKSVFPPFKRSINNQYEKQIARHLTDSRVQVKIGNSSKFCLKKV